MRVVEKEKLIAKEKLKDQKKPDVTDDSKKRKNVFF